MLGQVQAAGALWGQGCSPAPREEDSPLRGDAPREAGPCSPAHRLRWGWRRARTHQGVSPNPSRLQEPSGGANRGVGGGLSPRPARPLRRQPGPGRPSPPLLSPSLPSPPRPPAAPSRAALPAPSGHHAPKVSDGAAGLGRIGTPELPGLTGTETTEALGGTGSAAAPKPAGLGAPGYCCGTPGASVPGE